MSNPSVLKVLLNDASDGSDWTSQIIAILVLAILALGTLTCAGALSNYAQFVWRQFLRPAKDPRKYGEWAIVTGATDGIGREYCNYLAKAGMKIYLVSRTEEKLKAAAEEISSKYSVETQYYVADLVQAGRDTQASCWYGLKQNLASMDVGILVNNAGMSYDHPEYYDALPDSKVEDIVAINIVSLSKMTKAVLPGMKQRGRGCIVNISSGVSSYLPSCPLLAVYAASKAYVDNFTKSLAAEYKEFKIDIQVQPPYFVATKMSKIRKSSLTVPYPKTWVAAAMRHIGHETSACVFPIHATMTGVASLLPESFITSQWLGMSKTMRSKALKKKVETSKMQ